MEYIKIERHDGGTYIQPLNEIANAMDGELDGLEVGESVTLTFTRVEMAEEEYLQLPDFPGH